MRTIALIFIGAAALSFLMGVDKGLDDRASRQDRARIMAQINK